MSKKATCEALTTYRREQIEAWRASGESQQAFCTLCFSPDASYFVPVATD